MRTNDVLFDRFESESVERASWFESCIQYAQLCMLCHRLGLKEPQTDTASLHFVYMSPFSFLSPFSFHACLSWDFVCLFFVIFVIFFCQRHCIALCMYMCGCKAFDCIVFTELLCACFREEEFDDYFADMFL